MGDRFGTLALKGVGVLLAAFLVLAAVATVVGVVLGVIATIVSAVVTLAILAVLGLAAYGLFSLLRGGESERDGEVDGDWWSDGRETETPADDRDLEERIRERYVAGEIDEAEFERKLDLLHGTGDGEASGIDASARELDRLRDR